VRVPISRCLVRPLMLAISIQVYQFNSSQVSSRAILFQVIKFTPQT
jgi:hypothetical protein